ncbi:MAG: heavy-metal-associated domain-containing protein [Planctomycetes bacterium]|nr:heavy-metal-associated domain-containing protein [Planctomycetota bacterium]
MKLLTLTAALLLAACSGPTQQYSAEDFAYSSTLKVKGMSCPNCANNITHELMEIPGVEHVDIDMGAGRVSVLSNEMLPPDFKLQEAVRSAGFTPVVGGK